MKLIVGLGNPGKEYEGTRHNVGFMVIDNYLNCDKFKSKFNGLYLDKTINGEKIIFLKPQSYMNLSGEVVYQFVHFYKIPNENILIIRDDLDLEIGTAKIKFNSSSGGDNGIKSIISYLKTQEFYQFKIGISNDKNIDTKDYVLSNFSKNEMANLNKIFELSKDVIDSFIKNSGDKTISEYNRILK